MAAYFHKPMLLSDIPYFRSMIEEFPSFGKLSKLYNFKELVTKSVNEDLSSYYSPNDIERFEMCEPIDCSEHDVFRTEIYFDREQRILISPKFFNLIRDYIKEDEYIAIF